MGKSNKHARIKFTKWLNTYNDVASWIDRKCPDLEQLLEEHGGLVKIEKFLPPFVADGILELLNSIDDRTWNLTAATDDYIHNNIRHEFLSVKRGPPGLDDVFRVFTLLMSDSLSTFSAAKYCKAGYIVPHDDRAYTNVLMDDGSVELCSRRIACIYYLTKGWSDDDGGQLVDLEAQGGPQAHIPEYNSLIAFTIPRWHEVKPVTGNRPRYSVFGWFLEPGKLYELHTGNQTANQQQQQQQQDVEADHQQCPRKLQGHQKRRRKQQKQHTEGPGNAQIAKKPRLQGLTADPKQQRQQQDPQQHAPEQQQRSKDTLKAHSVPCKQQQQQQQGSGRVKQKHKRQKRGVLHHLPQS